MKQDWPAITAAQRAIMAGDYSSDAVQLVVDELLAADPVRPGVFAINEARLHRDNFVDGTEAARFWDRVIYRLAPPTTPEAAPAEAESIFTAYYDEASRALDAVDFSGAAAGRWADEMLAAAYPVPTLARARAYRDAQPIGSPRAEFFRCVIRLLILRGAGAPAPVVTVQPSMPDPSFDRDPEQGSLF